MDLPIVEDYKIKGQKVIDSGFHLIKNPRQQGSHGHIFEGLFDVPENNLPEADLKEDGLELKAQLEHTTSRVTLGSREPSSNMPFSKLISRYGWKHRQAGKKYPLDERSLYTTLRYLTPNSRGFYLDVDEKRERVYLKWDPDSISKSNLSWSRNVTKQMQDEIKTKNNHTIITYWTFDELKNIIDKKLKDTLLALTEASQKNGANYIRFKKIVLLENCTIESFLAAIKNGLIVVEFRARSGHNHGTAFRISRKHLPSLYQKQTQLA